MIDSFLRHNQEKYLAEFASKLPSGYTRTDTGEVAIFHPIKMNNSKPSILVATGWHGDEQGATLGLMDFVAYSVLCKSSQYFIHSTRFHILKLHGNAGK